MIEKLLPCSTKLSLTSEGRHACNHGLLLLKTFLNTHSLQRLPDIGSRDFSILSGILSKLLFEMGIHIILKSMTLCF